MALKRKTPEAPAADPLAEQVAHLAVRVQQLEDELAAFKQKVSSNVNLPAD